MEGGQPIHYHGYVYSDDIGLKLEWGQGHDTALSLLGRRWQSSSLYYCTGEVRDGELPQKGNLVQNEARCLIIKIH